MSTKKRVGVALGGVLLALLAAPLVLSAYLDSDSGHEALRARLEQHLTDRVLGTVHLEAVDAASFESLAVSGLRIDDSAGDIVVEVAELRASATSWRFLVGSAIELSDVELIGGRIVVRRGERSAVSLLELLPPSTRSTERRALDTGWMRIRDFRLEVYGQATVANIRGEISLRRDDQGPAEIDVRGAHATLERPQPLGARIQIADAALTVRPETSEPLELSSGGCLGGSPVALHFLQSSDSAVLKIDKEGGLGALARIGLGALGAGAGVRIVEEELEIEMPECPAD